MKISAVILAAGQGTRMRSELPKVLHLLAGKPLAWHALEAARQVTGERPVMVVGHGAEAVRRALGEDAAEYVLQSPQLGTGHAVLQAEAVLKERAELVLVTYADMPLVTPATLRRLVAAHRAQEGPITMLTVTADDPRGFGRVVREANGRVLEIVEEAQATPEQLAIRELNTGLFCFSADWLWPALHRIQLSPKGEYYLTDLAGLAVADGLPVKALVADDPLEVIGINTRLHLAEAEALLRRRINQAWMLQGVTMINPEATYIEPGVTIGNDTVLWPNTYLRGDTQIGAGCEVGPNTIILDSQVGDACTILASVLEGATVEDHVEIGPFARLRKGAHLAQGVHMGNFGEVKNSYLGPGAKMGHFSYLGDATIGPEVNIGAGTITCNFDGTRKHPTEIGEGAFIGSDTMLVAPVKVGEGARTGAGSVVTRDVPPYSLAVGVPARVIRKLERPD
jgi:bifunctional UDP-N-acetylglucosamine pyrophosphorylase/glucosamine-1-phosphate N-acetyltransferase